MQHIHEQSKDGNSRGNGSFLSLRDPREKDKDFSKSSNERIRRFGFCRRDFFILFCCGPSANFSCVTSDIKKHAK